MTVRDTRMRLVGALLGLAALGGAFMAGNWTAAQAPVIPIAPAAFRAERPAYRGIDANLYVQTAAEYRACCYQAYNLATLRLRQGLARKPAGKPAVVADLDETILDNAGFQAMMLRSNLAYDQRLWDRWEESHPDLVALVPGAREFLREADQLGVAVVYISNRAERYRKQTRQILVRLGLPLPADDRLKLMTGNGDKTGRRKEAERDFTVLLYLGDNLRDFSERFRYRKLDPSVPGDLDQAIRERKQEVDTTRADWGQSWIILPNPVYGEWMKPLGRGRGDLDRLAPPATPR